MRGKWMEGKLLFCSWDENHSANYLIIDKFETSDGWNNIFAIVSSQGYSTIWHERSGVLIKGLMKVFCLRQSRLIARLVEEWREQKLTPLSNIAPALSGIIYWNPD